ncbi:MAG: invasion associated locus B family protein [Ancalomicrobiaceae bacterium]|nr:invasion associated locus B family protein [Ancalomicrobiaceae bacterium]
MNRSNSIVVTAILSGFIALATIWLAPLNAFAEGTGPTSATLPGGASSLQETFGDWRVACVVQGQTKRCALVQEQVNEQTHQRILTIELGIVGEKLEGVLLTPFGLALDRGVQLQIDDQSGQQALKFRTCLPGGCLVPLSFDSKVMAGLRAGSAIRFHASADGGQDQLFTVSLKGFGSALDRVGALVK